MVQLITQPNLRLNELINSQNMLLGLHEIPMHAYPALSMPTCDGIRNGTDGQSLMIPASHALSPGPWKRSAQSREFMRLIYLNVFRRMFQVST